METTITKITAENLMKLAPNNIKWAIQAKIDFFVEWHTEEIGYQRYVIEHHYNEHQRINHHTITSWSRYQKYRKNARIHTIRNKRDTVEFTIPELWQWIDDRIKKIETTDNLQASSGLERCYDGEY